MLTRKQPGRHPLAGSVYYWALACASATMTTLAISRWREDYHLFALGILSFAAATIGRRARRRRWPAWARVHLTGMGSMSTTGQICRRSENCLRLRFGFCRVWLERRSGWSADFVERVLSASIGQAKQLCFSRSVASARSADRDTPSHRAYGSVDKPAGSDGLHACPHLPTSHHRPHLAAHHAGPGPAL